MVCSPKAPVTVGRRIPQQYKPFYCSQVLTVSGLESGQQCRGSSEEHTPAPRHADRSSTPVVASPLVINMECASSSST